MTTPALLTPDTAGLAAAADLLAAGKLVILPTETVYGIALNLRSPEARAAARQYQNLSVGTTPAPWVLHLPDTATVLSWVPSLSAMGKRLLQRALPGPVAFQIKLAPADLAAARHHLGDAADETIADGHLILRCPDSSATQKILKAAEAQNAIVAIIGAGTTDRPAIYQLSDLPDEFHRQATGGQGVGGGEGGGDRVVEGLAKGWGGGQSPIAAILDAGPTRYRKSSTLVKIDGDSFTIARPGVIDARIIQKMADFSIVFVCTGNTCRSPMAAALAGRLLADRFGISPSELPLRHIHIQSAGLHANRGSRAAREAIETLAPLKTDIAAHLSQPMTIDILRRADVIYTMTNSHRAEIIDWLPAAEHKTYRLDPQEDVEDPIGAGLAVYKEVADRLVELLKARLSELPL